MVIEKKSPVGSSYSRFLNFVKGKCRKLICKSNNESRSSVHMK